MPKRIAPKSSNLTASLRALRDAEHDSGVIREMGVLVEQCVGMIAIGRHDAALAYAGMVLEAAKDLRTEFAREYAWEGLRKLDTLLVTHGLIASYEESICTMPGAEA